jgi:hypothetical protein
MKLSRFFVSSMKFTSVHGTFLTWYVLPKEGRGFCSIQSHCVVFRQVKPLLM